MIKKGGKYIFDVYFGDNNCLVLGDGSLDWKKIIDMLKDIGYIGGLVMEVCFIIDWIFLSCWIELGG